MRKYRLEFIFCVDQVKCFPPTPIQMAASCGRRCLACFCQTGQPTYHYLSVPNPVISCQCTALTLLKYLSCNDTSPAKTASNIMWSQSIILYTCGICPGTNKILQKKQKKKQTSFLFLLSSKQASSCIKSTVFLLIHCCSLKTNKQKTP